MGRKGVRWCGVEVEEKALMARRGEVTDARVDVGAIREGYGWGEG